MSHAVVIGPHTATSVCVGPSGTGLNIVIGLMDAVLQHRRWGPVLEMAVPVTVTKVERNFYRNSERMQKGTEAPYQLHFGPESGTVILRRKGTGR